MTYIYIDIEEKVDDTHYYGRRRRSAHVWNSVPASHVLCIYSTILLPQYNLTAIYIIASHMHLHHTCFCHAPSTNYFSYILFVVIYRIESNIVRNLKLYYICVWEKNGKKSCVFIVRWVKGVIESSIGQEL